MNMLTDTFTLHNGCTIPCIGFGTWQAAEGEEAMSAVTHALEVGYRHIDTAAAYDNEKSIGKAVKASGIDRSELFITSKVWTTDRSHDRCKAAFYESLERLQLDYLDLYLIHWPASASRYWNWETINLETWSAMTELYEEGLIRAIGVSNFFPQHLKPLLAKAKVLPMVNQVELHPGELPTELLSLCKEHAILVEAWGPLGRGKLLSDPRIQELAAKYGKTAAQLCVRWCLQHGVLPLPKSATPSRIAENAQVFDFAISQEDMEIINQMPKFGSSGLHPDKVNF